MDVLFHGESDTQELLSFLNKRIRNLLPILPQRIGIALSGGSDSLCLAYLLSAWANTHALNIRAFIVDHGLRPESSQEALRVKHWVEDWGVPVDILTWKPSEPFQHVSMARARKGRYATLALACHAHDIGHLFLGHHQDDLLETIWMRQKNQSSWRGLAGISALTYIYGLALLRPFLSIPKTQLKAVLQHLHHPWIEDPTNQNQKFLRTQARYALQTLSINDKKMLKEKILLYAKHRAEETSSLANMYRPYEDFGFIVMRDFPLLCGLSKEKGGLFLRAWINHFTHTMCSLDFLYRLWTTLTQAFTQKLSTPPAILATGGGCLFVRFKDDLHIFREKPRRTEHAPISKEPSNFLWQDRFFCYNKSPFHGRNVIGGSWQRRYALASFPPCWPDPAILYRPCAPPYPVFYA